MVCDKTCLTLLACNRRLFMHKFMSDDNNNVFICLNFIESYITIYLFFRRLSFSTGVVLLDSFEYLARWAEKTDGPVAAGFVWRFSWFANSNHFCSWSLGVSKISNYALDFSHICQSYALITEWASKILSYSSVNGSMSILLTTTAYLFWRFFSIAWW